MLRVIVYCVNPSRKGGPDLGGPNFAQTLVYPRSDPVYPRSNRYGMSSTTLAAERQVRDFLIGPRNKKQRKKRATIKILPNYKLAFPRKLSTQMPVRVSASSRCTPAVFAAPIGRNTRLWV
jgi:hypothetical protein